MGDITKKVAENKWFVGIRERQPNDDVFDLSGLQINEPPRGHYMADPFVIKHQGQNYLFFELYDYDKGRIAVSPLKKGDSYHSLFYEIVIQDPLHMSFPALFADEDGQIYMTPETTLSGELRIYRAVEFPYKWEIFRVVTTGRYDDPIMFKQNGYYYIMATEGGNALRVLRAKNLTDDWIFTYREDILHSRAGGQVFLHHGQLVRPTQNCLQRYGHSMVIKVLGTNQVIRTIEPNWHPGLTGTHTFNFNEDFVVIDGRIKL